MLLKLCTLFIALLIVHSAYGTVDVAEQRIMDVCLERYGGLNYDTGKRLERFKQWSDKYEEIPCFTKCYLSEMYDFYDETKGFIAHKVREQFGEPLFNACQEHLESQEGNSCQRAYNAFHCLVKLENDPLIMIENMQNLTVEAKTAMKQCLVQFDAENWSRIRNYGTYPVLEPLPCFTQCFIGKLNLINYRTQQWNLEAMRVALGVPIEDANIAECTKRRRFGRNRCAAIYKQFTCFVLAQ